MMVEFSTTRVDAGSNAIAPFYARDPFAPALFAIWLMYCAVFFWIRRDVVAAGLPAGPDDMMRLVQVRDLLAGQSWYDVSQHRMNPPEGAPMHWSRLVDLPIAVIIAFLRPVVGTASAEFAALLLVPALTLLAALAATGLLVRRLAGSGASVLAMFFAGGIIDVLHQLGPMRIDHHGWQMALGVASVAAVMAADRPWRAGAFAGGAMALWTHISIEGLPYAILLAAALTLRLLIVSRSGSASHRHAALITAYLLSLSIISLTLFVATHPSSTWLHGTCDAVGASHLFAFLTAAVMSLPLLIGRLNTLPVRLTVLSVAAVGSASMFAGTSPQCLSSPFASLDPLVREFWYLNVMEGMPLWQTDLNRFLPVLAMMTLATAGAYVGFNSSTASGERADWAVMVVMMAGSLVIAFMVSRAAGVASLLALPGLAVLAKMLLKHARAIPRAGLRIPATTAAILLTLPVTPLFLSTAYLIATKNTLETAEENGVSFIDFASSLAKMPPKHILAPLDLAPSLLLLTSHTVIASAHHRNAAAMRDVIAAYTGTDREAYALIRDRRVDLVANLPLSEEMKIYRRHSPDGFAAQLTRGREPDWLEAASAGGMKNSEGISLIWEVKDPLRRH